jgi:hypothetical protein
MEKRGAGVRRFLRIAGGAEVVRRKLVLGRHVGVVRTGIFARREALFCDRLGGLGDGFSRLVSMSLRVRGLRPLVTLKKQMIVSVRANQLCRSCGDRGFGDSGFERVG